jgi:hypothetical protein
MALATEKFVQWMTARVNAHQDAMRSMSPDAAFNYICRIVFDNDVAIGVFPDPTQPNDIGLYPIKGGRHLEALRVGDIPDDLHCDVVPCAELGQAIAAERLFGDKAS